MSDRIVKQPVSQFLPQSAAEGWSPIQVPLNLIRRLPQRLFEPQCHAVVNSPSCHLSLLLRNLRIKTNRPVGI
ncbi:hypothetical protein KAX17_14595, partial [Candidatus Bipolaricaulota bacterium]|nr:hypothetical protein [Candidatus Bipolaricaulota bacterium]